MARPTGPEARPRRQEMKLTFDLGCLLRDEDAERRAERGTNLVLRQLKVERKREGRPRF